MKYLFIILIFAVFSNCKIHTPPIQDARESGEYLNLTPNSAIGQSFIPESDNMTGISFLLPGKAETLELSVYEIKNNTLDLKRKIQLKNFESGVRGSRTIFFEKIKNSRGKKYYCELKITDAGLIKAGYSKKNVYESGELFINNSEIKDNDLYFKIASEISFKEILRTIYGRIFFDGKFLVFFASSSILLLIIFLIALKRIL